MAKRLVQQPNGLYAVFSTVVDEFVVEDATMEEVIEFGAEYAAESARREWAGRFKVLESRTEEHRRESYETCRMMSDAQRSLRPEEDEEGEE